MTGLAALCGDGGRSARTDDAVSAFARALEATALTHHLDFKDLVLLHLCARAGRDEGDALVVSFRKAFPHAQHLIAPERPTLSD